MTLCLGIDPDTHDLAIASWDDEGPVRAHVVHSPRRKGVIENEAVLAMMTALSDTLPPFDRERPDALIDGRECELAHMLPDACAVEAQEWVKARGISGRSLLPLANVAGMAIMRIARGYLCGPAIYFPKPEQWKGKVAKHAMQARLYTELGWGYEIRGSIQKHTAYAEPKHFEAFAWTSNAELKFSQWKHIGDALLLARWCWEQQTGRDWVAPKKEKTAA